jgi:methyl coenzyme M reductase subunit D
LASDDEKALLERIFERIGENLSNHSRDRLKNYSFAMSGINQSVRIENWIAEKDLTNVFHTEEELLDLILSFFKETTSIKKCHDEFDQICKMWIAGKTPLEISQETNCDVSDIDDLCNKIISYELNFFVGNISDLIVIQENNTGDEMDEDDVVDPRNTLSILQKKIKYGVPTQTAISICEKVFNDRILSQKITSVLGNDNVETDTIIRLIQFCDTLVLDVLEDYPEYFKDRVDYLIGD